MNTPDPNTVHTLPTNDLIEHDDTGTDCPCGPAVTIVPNPTGPDGWHVLHHSLDGRENKTTPDHPTGCDRCDAYGPTLGPLQDALDRLHRAWHNLCRAFTQPFTPQDSQ